MFIKNCFSNKSFQHYNVPKKIIPDHRCTNTHSYDPRKIDQDINFGK